MKITYNSKQDGNRLNPSCCLVLLIIGTVLFILFGSCRTHGSVSSRVVYDTVWSVKVIHDSIQGTRVEREMVRIEPHIVRLKDTTIIYADTTVVRNVEGQTVIYKQYLHDRGEISKDSAYKKESQYVSREKTNTDCLYKWRLLWVGILIGVLAALIVRYRRTIAAFIGRMVMRRL